MVIPARPSAGFRRLAVWTAIVTYLLIVWGGIVRVTGSGNGCGTTDQWPLCHGSLLPAWQINTLIEFTHRWIASICTILVVVLTVSAWVWHRHRRKILVGVTVAAVLFVVQIALGAITVEANLPGGVVMLHLANALLLFAVLIYVAVESTTEGTARHSQGLWAAANASLKIPVLIAVVATYVVALSGAFLVATNSTGGCSSWPLCGSGFSLPTTQSATINVAHRVIAGVVVVALGGLMAMIRRRRRGDRPVSIGVMALNLLLVLQVAAGALDAIFNLPAGLSALHIALASMLWGAVVAVALLSLQVVGEQPVAVSSAQAGDAVVPRTRVAQS